MKTLYDVNKKYSVSGKSCFVNFNRPNKINSNRIKNRLNKSYDEHHWDPRCTRRILFIRMVRYK